MSPQPIPIITLGQTQLAVSRIGLGLAALGRPGYINLGHSVDLDGQLDVEAMEARAFEVLETAWSRGVRYFDAARSYGRAEAFLASWLNQRGIDPGRVTIGSKWGYTYTADWQIKAERHEVKDHSLPTLQRQANESASLLGTYLDLYQIHSATIESGVLDDRAVLNELGRIKVERGWKIGLSLTGPRQASTLAKALELKFEGALLFDAVQATWNLLEPSSGPALAEAHAAGLGVIIKEGLANGRLTDRNNDPSFVRSKAILQDQADRLKTTIDALALAAVLARPWANVILSGASTVDQLNSNLEANSVPWDEEAESTLGPLAEVAEDYWSTRARLAWN